MTCEKCGDTRRVPCEQYTYKCDSILLSGTPHEPECPADSEFDDDDQTCYRPCACADDGGGDAFERVRELGAKHIDEKHDALLRIAELTRALEGERAKADEATTMWHHFRDESIDLWTVLVKLSLPCLPELAGEIGDRDLPALLAAAWKRNEEYCAKMSTLDRLDGGTCGGCKHFKPYDGGCDDHPGGCGWCPVWDHVRADEPRRIAEQDDAPCDHYTPRGKETP